MASSSLVSIPLPLNVFELNNIVSLVLTLTITSILLAYEAMAMAIPTTLDGPFKPVTIPLDKSLRGNAIDLPDTDPRVQRTVEGFEPEQISVSLSSTHDAVWISWITGTYLFFFLNFFDLFSSFNEELEFSADLSIISYPTCVYS